MEKIPVYILAGGKSRRFGSDKARVLLSGKPLILHVAEVTRPFASRITAVADVAGKYEDLGLHTIADVEPGRGPLGGLQAALRDCEAGRLLLVSCDFAGLQRGWVETLLAAPPASLAVAFKGKQWEPMLAVFSREVLPVVERRLKEGERAMWSLLDALNAAALPLPEGWPESPGVNTEEELERFR